ncbi:MAG: hypothetical protein QOJ58_5829 [Alphaproteobacteria bacterium]|jgi:hypothetical protein|nr:hypothetical protein [Alphaproteobacteria bacterium]
MRVAISEMPLAWKVLWSGESRTNASPADAGGHQVAPWSEVEHFLANWKRPAAL